MVGRAKPHKLQRGMLALLRRHFDSTRLVARKFVCVVHFGCSWTPNMQQEDVEGFKRLVGPPGFEPGTSCTPSRRASQAAPRPERFILPH